jgi:hypothetical protein
MYRMVQQSLYSNESEDCKGVGKKNSIRPCRPVDIWGTAPRGAPAHSVRLKSAGRNVPCETGIFWARVSGWMEPLAVPSNRKPL